MLIAPFAASAADDAPNAPRAIGRRLRSVLPRFRFTMRAMLVVTTLLCLAMAYQLNWIRHRRAALADGEVTAVQILDDAGDLVQPPGILSYFGERGQPLLIVHGREGDAWLRQRARLARLFPEAEIRQDVLDAIYDAPAPAHETLRR